MPEIKLIGYRVNDEKIGLELDQDIDSRIAEKRGEIDEQNMKLAEMRTPASEDEADAAIRAEIANLEAQIAEGKAKYAEEANAAQTARNVKINAIYVRETSLKLEITEAKEEIATNIRALKVKRENLEYTKKCRERLLEEHKTVSDQLWDAANDNCPTCKQPWPVSDLEAMKEEFNLKRSQKLADLTAQGKEVGKDVIAKKEEAISEIEKAIEASESIIAEKEKAIAAIHEELRSVSELIFPPPYENSDNYKSLISALNKAKSERAQGKDKQQSGASEAVRAQEAAIKVLSDELSSLLEAKAKIEQTEKLKARIKELSDQEKKLAGDYERTEHGLYLCELFVRAKVSMLTNSINGKFQKVRFRLFREQLNGGIVDDCEVLVPGQGGAFVPWGEGANTGAKINAGLEIIGVLSMHWGVSLPIICDNAECVSDWTEIDAQVIKLAVTTADDKLRIVHGE
jgi:chromosome segregation ATPase